MFEINEWTAATIGSLTPRNEKHGDEDVPALSLHLKIKTANSFLDKFTPKDAALRHALYKAVEDQPQLPEVEEATPLLRVPLLEALTLKGKLEGWTLLIDYGVDGEEDPMTLGACKVDAFRVMPHEGGTVDVMLRVGTSDVTPEQAGILWSKNGHEITVQLHKPKAKEEAIDGTVGHRGAGAAGEKSATDLFVETHG